MSDTTTRVRPRKPATLSVPFVGKLLGFGRSASYSQAQTGEMLPGVPVLQVKPRRWRVPTSAVEHVLGIDIADYLDDPEVETANND